MQSDTRIGTQFAGYEIESLLGRGGMAVVYLASDPRLGRKVALKVLASELSDDGRFRDRFIRESRLAASLDHPNIIPVYDAGEFEGTLYIAMRCVVGVDLKALIAREGHLPVARALSICSQVAGALDSAHARGLVHRDVKPANILIAHRTGSEAADYCYLSDFGLAKNSTSSTGLTQTGQFVGTLDYVAPEQIEGKPTDGRADTYALAAVFYECVVGHPPFDRENSVSVMYAHLLEPPPKLTAKNSHLPARLDEVLAKAMAKAPADRYASSGDFVNDARLALVTVTSEPVARDATVVTAAPVVATAAAPVADLTAGHATPRVDPGQEALAGALAGTPPLVAAAAPALPAAAPPALAAPATSATMPWREAPPVGPRENSVQPWPTQSPHRGSHQARNRVAAVVAAVVVLSVLGAFVLNDALTGHHTVADTTPTPSAASTTSQPSSSPGQQTTVSGVPVADRTAVNLNQIPENYGFAMGYDPISKQIILFGGYDSDGNDQNDTWAWNGSTWSQLNPATAPPPENGATLVLDPSTGQLDLFGSDGGDNGSWTWNGNNWVELPGSPQANGEDLNSPNAAADLSTGQIVINGNVAGVPPQVQGQGQGQGQGQQQGQGQGQGGPPTASYTGNGSTWTSTNNPTALSTAGWPSGAGIAYDTKTKHVLEFGGVYDGGEQNQTFSWNGSTWSDINAQSGSGPQLPLGPASAAGNTSGTVLMVGQSVTSSGRPSSWTWQSSTSTWINWYTHEPPANGYFQIVFDPAVGGFLLLNLDQNNGANTYMEAWTGTSDSEGWQPLSTK